LSPLSALEKSSHSAEAEQQNISSKIGSNLISSPQQLQIGWSTLSFADAIVDHALYLAPLDQGYCPPCVLTTKPLLIYTPCAVSLGSICHQQKRGLMYGRATVAYLFAAIPMLM
jgi:hypothetical protein